MPMPTVSLAKLYEVRESAIHHRGVFAACDIPPDQRIIQYIGEKITKKESNRRALALVERAKSTGEAAVYIFTLNSRYDLDGATTGNDARYMNHSCDPNCEVFIEKGEIWIYSKRAIQQSEELCYNYGFDLDTWDEHPCLCGTERCVGSIVGEEFWPALKKKIASLKRSAAKHARANGV